MNNDLEYNFINNQIDANRKIQNAMQFEITQLVTIISQKRKWIDELTNVNEQLMNRAQEINKNNDKSLIKHYE